MQNDHNKECVDVRLTFLQLCSIYTLIPARHTLSRSDSRDTDGLRRLTCVTDGCSVNQTKALDRVVKKTQHASLQLRSILLLARTTSWLFPDGQTAGCESTFTLERLGIAVSDVMCILCAEKGQELHGRPAGCWAIKKRKKHIESKLLFKQNYTNNRPQQMVQLGSGTHPLNRNVKNTIPLIG